MSVPQPQRVRRNASPTTKQGPMRATLPFCLMRQGSPTRPSKKSVSPTMTWPCDGTKSKYRKSPDIRRSSPERRSPGSPSLKVEKSKLLGNKSQSSSVIRRTASLDAIYLKGQWPREGFRTYCGIMMFDKSTQTEEWNEIIEKRKGLHPRNSVGNGDQIDKVYRTRLQRNKEGNRQSVSGGQRQSPVHGDHSAVSAVLAQSNVVSRPLAIPNIPKPLMPRMRNSVEGLNQEIERLVLKGNSGNDYDLERIQEPTPDGHRAPIADLLRSTRSVNTQTPSNGSNGGGDESSQSSGQGSRCHSMSPPIPMIVGMMDTPQSSQNEIEINTIELTQKIKDLNKSPSPEPDQKYGCSPLNKFLAREPPDGCERVKMSEEPRTICILPDPLKPRDGFILQPSQGSAFCPLRRSYCHQAPEFVLKSVTQANQAATIEGK